ncbi:MAG: hypothetical protein ACRC6R_03200 [Bacteroidales bacterium]
MKKDTRYLRGAISLWVTSMLVTGCSSNASSTAQDTTWADNDTVPGKVVHDKDGNEWIWHSGSNMLMGYWLINSMRSGAAPSRYYPSTSSYTTDGIDKNVTSRPSYVSPTPMKSSEARMATSPSVNQPLNRSAIKSGYAVPTSRMTPVGRSSRGGFGTTGRSSSTGASS